MAGALFVNILIIITPVFLYQLLMLDRVSGSRASTQSEWIWGLLSGLASALCMIFPIVSGNGYLWDLRWVPYLIAHLYGGWRGGIVAFVCLVGYRGYVGGGMGFYTVIFDALLLTALVPLLRPRFQASIRHKKLLIGVLLSLVTFLLVMGTICYYFAFIHRFDYILQQSRWLYGFMMLSYALGMIVSVLLIENIFENANIRAEISRREKLNLISQLAASVAHEVRNPLTVVRGFIQLASTTMNEANRNYMTTAIAELDRAEFIISDFLNFAKPEIEELEMVDVSEELQSTAELMSSFALLHNVVMQTQLESDLYIRVDKAKFKQVIMNLIKNGIESIQNGGTLRVVSFQHNQHVVLQVIDTGVGMSAEQLERLGQPFYTTKDKGTGLGLMVTFRLVEAMQGTLRFHSEKDKGTKAIITIPIALQP